MDLDIAQLQATDRIFHLLRQRNKNQHRRSKWWKWFSMLKRCVSNLIHEVQAKESWRAQARLQHFSQVLLPRCHSSFTQLIQDIQFSTLGLTLLAELSKIRSSLASRPTQADDKTSLTMKPADSTIDIPLTFSEDVGEAVGRDALSIVASIGTNNIPAFDPLVGPGCLTNVEKHLDGKKRAGLDATKAANVEIKTPKPQAGAAITGPRADARSTSIQWQEQREHMNAIDDLFPYPGK
ncbi:hypothetical protein BDR22DRAFT_148911 [Usnea florida]